jgi:phosphate-selective porin
MTFFLGKAEKGMKDTHFGEKNGVILGVYGTTQSKVQQTAIGTAGVLKYSNSVSSTAINPAEVNNAVKSTSYGTDLLVNYKGFNMKAEYTAAKYTGLMGTVNTAKGDYGIASYDVIGGYTFDKVGPGAMEVALGYSVVDADDKIKLGDLSIVDNKYGAIYGDVNLLDLGLNYYLSKEKYKINLHYVIVDEKPTDTNYDHYNNNFLALGLQYQW